MKNQLIFVKEAKWKSIVLRDDELWLSKDKISNLEKFEAAVNTPHNVKEVVFKHPLEKLMKLKFNESSDTVAYEYLMKTKNKSMDIKFNSSTEANAFGNYLGQQLQFRKEEKEESKTKPLLLNSLYVLIAAVGTFILGVYFDEGDMDSSSSGGRRSRSGGAIIRMLYNTIGQTGILILGTLITLYLAYQLYQRFQTPAKDIIYER